MMRNGWTIAYNGEIYNAPELRSKLTNEGCTFTSQCDTEVLCWALSTWGLDKALTKLNGMFAFAASDGESIYLVRDRLGIKPLYYEPLDGGLLFSSELTAMDACPRHVRTVCPISLQQYLLFGYVPAPRTIFENTRKVQPGEIIEWDGAAYNCRRYWQLKPEETGTFGGDFDDALTEGERLLRDSVKHRLLSDVPLGAFLSGGIDSSLVCALASQVDPGLQTFNIGFEEPEYDESAAARGIADHLCTQHTSVTMTSKELLETVPRIPSLFGEPFADASALPTYLLSHITRRQVTVALSGDGGDEQFFGYRRHLGYLALKKYERLPQGIRRFIGKCLHLLCGYTTLGRHGNALSYDNFAEATTLIVGHFHRVRHRHIIGRDPCLRDTSYGDYYERLQKVGIPVERIGPLLDLMFYLPDDILTKVDRASMAHSLEVRVPLLDHRFVEFAHHLPHLMKYDGHTQKLLLRRMLGRHVPAQLRERPKQGFGAPLDHWFRHELQDQLCDLLSVERLSQQGALNPSFVQSMLNEHLSGLKNHQHTLWNLYVLQQWADASGVTLPPLWRENIDA